MKQIDWLYLCVPVVAIAVKQSRAGQEITLVFVKKKTF